MTEMRELQTKTANVIGAGLVAVDIIQFCDSDWRTEGTSPAYTSGGTVCNILCYLARYGWRCAIIGTVGDEDHLSTVLRDDLRRFGVDTIALTAKPFATTRRIVHLIVNEGRRRGLHKFLTSCPRCGCVFPKVASPTYSEIEGLLGNQINASTILITDRVNEFTVELATRVAEKDGLVIFEPGHLPENVDLVSRLMVKVDVLKYSEGLEWGRQPFRKADLSRYSQLKLIIETRGAKGVKLVLPQKSKEIRLTTCPRVGVIDSAGAGDAFTSGFLLALGPEGLRHLNDLDDARLEAAISRSQAFGALACLFPGSKGLLYARENSDIEEEIKEIMDNRGLATTKFRRVEQIEIVGTSACTLTGFSDNGECPVCRIPQEHE